jgi:predicted permease
MIDRLRADITSALRALRTAPGTAAAAVLTLAVAVGLNLAMFGLIDRALLSPPPHVADPDGVFTLTFEPLGDETGRVRMTTTSYVAFESIRQHVAAASAVAAWQRQATAATVAGTQIRVDAMLVSGSYFELLGAQPRLGRGLLPADDRAPAGSAPAVLSHTFWMAAFGGDPSAMGRHLSISGVEYIIAGVMPPGFSGHSASRVDVWVPLHAAMEHSPGWDREPLRRVASVVMRVPAGGSPSAAAVQSGVATDRRVTLISIRGAEVVPVERRVAYWLAGVSVLVLVIGLANTATLLLVRGARRRRDLAIRTALGATRRRLLNQVVIDAGVLAAGSVVAALVLAYWFDEAIRTLLMPSLAESSGSTPRIAGAGGLAALLAFVVAAAAGTLQLPSRFTIGDVSGASAGRPRRRAHTALLLLQTTLSVVLLAGAGVFGRSLYNLISQDFGMRMDGVVLVEFDRGPSFGDRGELLLPALERIRALPGVELATPIGMVPFTGFHVPPISVPGLEGPPNVDGQPPFLLAATPELLQILDVRIIEGRPFTAADDRGAPVVIVNHTMARTVWPGTSALGKCIRIGFDPSFDPFTATGPHTPSASLPCREIVGVARDLRQRSVVPTGSEGRLMQYFVPFSQVPPPPAGVGAGPDVDALLLRASVAADALAAPIRRLVVGSRTDLPFLRVRPYSDLLEGQLRPWRRAAMLLSLFSALALGVAAIGLYAAFAHSVAERRREMAIRIAIGARPRGVLVMVLREAATVAGGGILCGMIVTALIGRWLQSLLFGTAPSDPLVLGATALLMLAVAAAATLVPARSASRADPNALLRTE